MFGRYYSGTIQICEKSRRGPVDCICKISRSVTYCIANTCIRNVMINYAKQQNPLSSSQPRGSYNSDYSTFFAHPHCPIWPLLLDSKSFDSIMTATQARIKEDQLKWSSASDYATVLHLNRQYFRGKMLTTPYNHRPVDNKTRPDDNLLSIHDYGLLVYG